MGGRARAILWAQWRTLWNHFPRANRAGVLLGAVLGVAWYAGFGVLGASACFLMADPKEISALAKILPGGLLLAFLYWQIVPLLLVSTGSSLDMRRLLAYPIPKRELFTLEVLLRFSTGVEVVIVLFGAACGLLLNPQIPKWAPLALAVFALFNLFVSAGVRDLLVRLFARRGVREILVFLFVLMAAIPQLLITTGTGARLHHLLPFTAGGIWPWIAAAGLAQGHWTLPNALNLGGWTLLAYAFGRSQFERGLRFDANEASAYKPAKPQLAAWTEGLFRLPGRLLPDPLAVLIEKELRVLSRSSRFRLVFLMGFSFGLLIWLPLTFGKTAFAGSWLTRNYLAMVSVYALVLLSDVLFWNVFGFDRSAAQIYFLTPVKLETVLLAKNLAAVFVILVEVSLIALMCALLRFPVRLEKLLEAYLVALTVSSYFMAAGNLSSAYNPKPVNPSKSFRSNAGRHTQALLMLLLPVGMFPVLLAYAARYAFQSDAAFFGVLLVDLAFGVITLRIASGSAMRAARQRQETILTVLGGGEGPLAA